MSEKKIKATAYVRVSHKFEKIENQILAIQEYAKRNNIEIVRIFKDIGVSGSTPTMSRLEFVRMLEFCKKHNIKLIIFYDISRMSRNILDGLLTLKKLTEMGFDYKFVAQEFLDYIEDPMLRKKVILDFLWFAELYIEDIRRRTKLGLMRAKLQGKHIGRPKKELKEYKNMIIRLWKKGLSARDIASVLEAKGVKVSPVTILTRLREWGVI